MKIGTLAASTTTTINLTWLPQYIYFVASSTPTALKVTVFGDGVITDMAAPGALAFGSHRLIGYVANSFMIALANGIVKNKNVEITITNAVAAAVDVFGIVREEGDVYVQILKQQILAGSGADITDFSTLAVPDTAVGDKYTITFEDGTVHDFTFTEIFAMMQFTQNELNTYLIDNLDGEIRKVNFIPAATQTVYVQRFSPVGDVAGGIFQAQL